MSGQAVRRLVAVGTCGVIAACTGGGVHSTEESVRSEACRRKVEAFINDQDRDLGVAPTNTFRFSSMREKVSRDEPTEYKVSGQVTATSKYGQRVRSTFTCTVPSRAEISGTILSRLEVVKRDG